MTLTNGRVPDDQLTLVQSGAFSPLSGDVYLLNDAAVAWSHMRAEGQRRFRVALNITSTGGGYRSLALQRDMYANPTKYGAKPGKVAKPGASVHGYGRCVDVYNWSAVGAYAFLLLAREFGFLTQTVAGETWHIEFPGGRAEVPSGGGGGGVKPIYQGDDDMVVLYCKDSNGGLWTIVDHANRVFDQTRSQDVGNAWASTVSGSSTMVNVTALGLLTKAYKQSPWPFLYSDLAGAGEVVALPADLARKSDIPTATQNGQAARDAIVKPA